MTATFDRVRPRTSGPRTGGESAPRTDVHGKAALFSRSAAAPSLGTVVITCSACHGATPISYLRALRLAVPSLHIPVLRRDFPSWMRCPDCGRRTWVRVAVR